MSLNTSKSIPWFKRALALVLMVLTIPGVALAQPMPPAGYMQVGSATLRVLGFDIYNAELRGKSYDVYTSQRLYRGGADLILSIAVQPGTMTIQSASHTPDRRPPWTRAWVTGAGRGIGAAVAEQLCGAGVDLYLSARSQTQLKALQARLSAAPGDVILAPLDICNAEQIRRLTEAWDRADNWPDLVVLNAGTHDPFSASDFTAGRALRLIETNVGGTLRCLEPVLRHFIHRDHGQIAVMASVAGYRGLPTAAAYGAGKAALINLCEALHLDLTGTNVKLQVICPGFVRTPLTDQNEFQMPALLEPDDAARRIIKGLQSDCFEIAFPGRFVYWLKLLHLLPYSWYFKLVAKATGVGRSQ